MQSTHRKAPTDAFRLNLYSSGLLVVRVVPNAESAHDMTLHYETPPNEQNSPDGGKAPSMTFGDPQQVLMRQHSPDQKLWIDVSPAVADRMNIALMSSQARVYLFGTPGHPITLGDTDAQDSVVALSHVRLTDADLQIRGTTSRIIGRSLSFATGVNDKDIFVKA